MALKHLHRKIKITLYIKHN